ncbi:hypothetical protein TNCV_342001 [Trichonephila clavipes]|nr:hypothetical protein TNCV_342001 [Trichonephila clavipes]
MLLLLLLLLPPDRQRPDRGHETPHGKGLVTPVVSRSLEHHTGDRTILLGFTPISREDTLGRTATAGSDVVQSGHPIFDDFFQHLWPYIGNNTADVVLKWSSVCGLSA